MHLWTPSTYWCWLIGYLNWKRGNCWPLASDSLRWSRVLLGSKRNSARIPKDKGNGRTCRLRQKVYKSWMKKQLFTFLFLIKEVYNHSWQYWRAAEIIFIYVGFWKKEKREKEKRKSPYCDCACVLLLAVRVSHKNGEWKRKGLKHRYRIFETKETIDRKGTQGIQKDDQSWSLATQSC